MIAALIVGALFVASLVLLARDHAGTTRCACPTCYDAPTGATENGAAVCGVHREWTAS